MSPREVGSPSEGAGVGAESAPDVDSSRVVGRRSEVNDGSGRPQEAVATNLPFHKNRESSDVPQSGRTRSEISGTAVDADRVVLGQDAAAELEWVGRKVGFTKEQAEHLSHGLRASFAREMADIPSVNLSALLMQDHVFGEVVSSVAVRAVVLDVIRSDLAQELLKQAQTKPLSDTDRLRVRQQAIKAINSSSAIDKYTAGEIAVIFSAMYSVIVAAVASSYGYEVGQVADAVAWPMALMGVAGFVTGLRKRDEQ